MYMYQLVEKLRLQCSAVYCLSWLFSPQLPVPRGLPCFSSSSTFFSSLFSLSRELLSSGRRRFSLSLERDAKSPSGPRVSGTGTGKTFLFPLVWRGWQFRGVSHRGAASRTNKSLEWRPGGEGRKGRLGWSGERAVLLLVTRIDHPV